MPVGPATTDMKAAFGRALGDAMQQADVSATEVARVAGVTPDAVRKWTNGRSDPDPLTVFAIEHRLGVEPGGLSHHLGYGPIPPAPTVERAVREDDGLDTDQRRGILSQYRAYRDLNQLREGRRT
jgi:transcriptional regulator with XRE-family HTH domain